MKESKAKSKLIIIDACHADSNYGTEQQKFDTDQALEIVYKSGITAIFSCRNDQESYPYNSGEISAFTQFLCDAINYKKSYQPEGLYLNDLKITIDAYARAWNLKNESKQQQPVLRSNMIGTIVLPLKNPPVVSERKTMTAWFETFDALDIKCQVKKPSSLKDYQKVYRANIVAKVDISDENIVAFAKDVIKELKSMNLQLESKKVWLIKNKTVDVIQLWIAKDYMDVSSENNNFAYQVYWEVADDLYWCKQLSLPLRHQYGMAEKYFLTDIKTEQEEEKISSGIYEKGHTEYKRRKEEKSMGKKTIKQMLSIVLTAAMIGTSYIPVVAEGTQDTQTTTEAYNKRRKVLLRIVAQERTIQIKQILPIKIIRIMRELLIIKIIRIMQEVLTKRTTKIIRMIKISRLVVKKQNGECRFKKERSSFLTGKNTSLFPFY